MTALQINTFDNSGFSIFEERCKRVSAFVNVRHVVSLVGSQAPEIYPQTLAFTSLSSFLPLHAPEFRTSYTDKRGCCE